MREADCGRDATCQDTSCRYLITLNIICYTLHVASMTESFQTGSCRLSMQYVASTSLSSNILDT